jgi:hypothetical protein
MNRRDFSRLPGVQALACLYTISNRHHCKRRTKPSSGFGIGAKIYNLAENIEILG